MRPVLRAIYLVFPAVNFRNALSPSVKVKKKTHIFFLRPFLRVRTKYYIKLEIFFHYLNLISMWVVIRQIIICHI